MPARSFDGPEIQPMMKLGKKPAGALAVSSDPVVRRVLDEVSKAALADALCQAIALAEGRADSPIDLDDLRGHLAPVLQVRGDRLPSELRPFRLAGDFR